MDLIVWQIIDSLLFSSSSKSLWLALKWNRTAPQRTDAGNIFSSSPSRMLTLREVSLLFGCYGWCCFCLLFHSKMGIKELISDIKGLKIQICSCRKKSRHSHGILLLLRINMVEKSLFRCLYVIDDRFDIDFMIWITSRVWKLCGNKPKQNESKEIKLNELKKQDFN